MNHQLASASLASSGADHPSKAGRLLWTTLALLWLYTIYRLSPLWFGNPDYAYGWFVPLLCLALFRERWGRRPARDPVRPAGGTIALLALIGGITLAGVAFLEVIPGWRFAGWFFAAAMLAASVVLLYFLGGRSWAHHFLFPFAFFLIAVPWPTRLEGPLIDKLSHLNAAASTGLVNLLGTPAVRQGVLIETGAGLVGVDTACSGIRSFQASVMVALFLGELFQFNFVRRMALLLAGAGFAFACNVGRTTYLVRTADQHGLAAVDFQHDPAGFTILGLTLAGLLVLTWLLHPRRRPARAPSAPATPPVGELLPVEDPAPPAAPPTAHWGRHTGLAALALGAWLLLLEVGVELWFRTAERSQLAQSPAWTLQLPRQKLEFSEPAIPPVVPKLLQYDEGRRAQWRDDRGHPWQMYYMRWATAQNRFRAAGSLIQAGHNTDICLQNVGMVHQTNFPPEILRQGPVPMRFQAQRFVASGTPYYIASAYWTPAGSPEPATKFVAAGSLYAMRRATDALRRRDRGWLEQRVIKIAAVDLESDALALPALRETVLGLVQPQAAPPIQSPSSSAAP